MKPLADFFPVFDGIIPACDKQACCDNMTAIDSSNLDSLKMAAGRIDTFRINRKMTAFRFVDRKVDGMGMR